MATQYVFAVGKMIASQPVTMHIDTRLAELLDWRRETGQELPLPADLILWLEDRGYVTDLLTGCTSRLEPLQEFIDAVDEDDDEPHPEGSRLQANERMMGTPPPTRDERADESAALYDNARYYEWCKREREDYEEYLAEIEWLRSGC